MGDGGNIDPSKIETAPVEVPTGQGPVSAQEQAMLAHESEKFKNELGWLGKPFGGRSEKPGNISALVILLSFIAIFYVYASPPKADSGVSLERIFGGLTSIITLILGYLFGSNEKSK